MGRSLSEREHAAVLAAAELEPLGWLRGASNGALLVRLAGAADDDPDALAVYKPVAGERPLADFPPGTLASRETAAFAVSEALGWGLVPATVHRDGPHGPGSVQRFVPHDRARHYFVLVDDPALHGALRRMALFDLLTNNADRKASHVLLQADGALLGCDHGLCFHREPKLRTVIWDFTGQPVETGDREDLARLARTLEDETSGLRAELAALLAPDEVAVLADRARQLAASERLPEPPEDRRPYPWPLL